MQDINSTKWNEKFYLNIVIKKGISHFFPSIGKAEKSLINVAKYILSGKNVCYIAKRFNYAELHRVSDDYTT